MSSSCITTISTLPTFVTPDEHASLITSTPSSFSSIPPVVHHTELNVRIALDPPVPEFDTGSDDGTLYILSSSLIYFSPTKSIGFSITYPSITLHAISRSGDAPSIYCQLDAGPSPDADPEDEEADTFLQELSIIPQNPSSLDQMFEALSNCAALHPDPASSFDDEEDDAFIDANSPFETFSGSADEELSEVGRAALAHMESIIYDPFDHGEDEEEEEFPPDSDEEDDNKKDAFEDADEDAENNKTLEGEQTY
ncbi:hypothetical protein H0H93_016628 [Arthromyces matolae]|nr:hypothetical protein H0H93_016628 [Arthromyces matolae]